MKKRILSLFTILMGLFLLAGCIRQKNIMNIGENNTGTIYEMVSLQDSNVTVFQSIVPKGWNSYIESKWDIINSTHPGRETVYLSSPDGRASIKIVSQESYVENKKYNEGENTEYYTTYLHYMNASDYLNYYMDKNYNGSKFVQDVDLDEKVLQQIVDYNNFIVNNSQEQIKILNSQGNVYITGTVYESTASKKQYEYGSNYIEASTAVAANKTTLESKLSSVLNSESITWIMPYTIIFSAEDKDAFDEYYDTYQFIVANSQFTVDYYAMVEYVSSSIVNAYTSYYAQKAQAGLDAMNNYIDSNYSSTSSKSTNEKVMEMWDDYINEVDAYKTEDGTILKTSMFNETVAQNGNEIYIGSKAGIPLGFTELDKSY